MVSGFIVSNPLLSITLISFFLTLGVTLVYKYTTDQNKLKSIREELKTIRKDMKENKADTKKMMALQKRSMEISMDQMKHTLKPTLITMLPILILFAWLQKLLPSDKIIFNLPFSIPKPGLNEGFGWVGIYIITSIVFSLIMRKILKVH